MQSREFKAVRAKIDLEALAIATTRVEKEQSTRKVKSVLELFFFTWISMLKACWYSLHAKTKLSSTAF